MIKKGFEAGAFDGIVCTVDLEIPGLGSFEDCKFRLKGAEFEG